MASASENASTQLHDGGGDAGLLLQAAQGEDDAEVCGGIRVAFGAPEVSVGLHMGARGSSKHGIGGAKGCARVPGILCPWGSRGTG